MWLSRMVDLGSRMKGSGANTNSEKSSLALRVSFGSIVSFKIKNLNSHSFFINGMWVLKIDGSILSSIGRGINLAWELGSNWVKILKSV